MPSPKSPDAPRRFVVTLQGGDKEYIRAPDRDKARAEIAKKIMNARPELDFKAARRIIKTCQVDPRDQLPVGRPKGATKRKPRNPNDHSAPHW